MAEDQIWKTKAPERVKSLCGWHIIKDFSQNQCQETSMVATDSVKYVMSYTYVESHLHALRDCPHATAV